MFVRFLAFCVIAFSAFIPLQVTGGSGYIAAHIVSELLKAGYRVRTYSISTILSAMPVHIHCFAARLVAPKPPNFKSGLMR
jgi:hypothetical protein